MMHNERIYISNSWLFFVQIHEYFFLNKKEIYFRASWKNTFLYTYFMNEANRCFGSRDEWREMKVTQEIVVIMRGAMNVDEETDTVKGGLWLWTLIQVAVLYIFGDSEFLDGMSVRVTQLDNIANRGNCNEMLQSFMDDNLPFKMDFKQQHAADSLSFQYIYRKVMKSVSIDSWLQVSELPFFRHEIWRFLR